MPVLISSLLVDHSCSNKHDDPFPSFLTNNHSGDQVCSLQLIFNHQPCPTAGGHAELILQFSILVNAVHV